MTTKLNRALFGVLRNKAAEKYPYPRQLNYSERRRLQLEALKKVVNKATKEVLKNYVLSGRDAVDFFNIDDDMGAVDTNKEARKALMDKIDKAELMFLAGDSAAAIALIEEVL